MADFNFDDVSPAFGPDAKTMEQEPEIDPLDYDGSNGQAQAYYKFAVHPDHPPLFWRTKYWDSHPWHMEKKEKHWFDPANESPRKEQMTKIIMHPLHATGTIEVSPDGQFGKMHSYDAAAIRRRDGDAAARTALAPAVQQFQQLHPGLPLMEETYDGLQRYAAAASPQKWVYLNGHVGFGDHHHQIVEQVARQVGLNDFATRQLANHAMVNRVPANLEHQIAWGHMQDGKPAFWRSNVDRNHVWDKVNDAQEKLNQSFHQEKHPEFNPLKVIPVTDDRWEDGTGIGAGTDGGMQRPSEADTSQPEWAPYHPSHVAGRLPDVSWKYMVKGKQKRAIYAQMPEHLADHMNSGYIAWHPDDGLISNVWVHPDLRRQGLATELLRRAREVDPHVHHAEPDQQSDDAKAWSEVVSGYSDVEDMQSSTGNVMYHGRKPAEGEDVLTQGIAPKRTWKFEWQEGDGEDPGDATYLATTPEEARHWAGPDGHVYEVNTEGLPLGVDPFSYNENGEDDNYYTRAHIGPERLRRHSAYDSDPQAIVDHARSLGVHLDPGAEDAMEYAGFQAPHFRFEPSTISVPEYMKGMSEFKTPEQWFGDGEEADYVRRMAAELGEVPPGLVNGDTNELMDGSHRLIAHHMAGEPTMPVLRVHHTGPNRYAAYDSDPKMQQFFEDAGQGLRAPTTELGPEDLPTRPDDQAFRQAWLQHAGPFDRHIETSIPGYAKNMARKGVALTQAFPGASVLDLAAGHGSFGKTLSQVGGMKTTNVDAAPHFRKGFEESPVPGADFGQYSLSDPFVNQHGQTVEQYPAGAKHDVVHEAMGFQFYSQDRGRDVAQAKAHLNPGGLAIFDEKFTHKDDPELEKANEAEKDKWKLKHFPQEALDAKNQEVGLTDQWSTGMRSMQADQGEFEQVLQQSFAHVAPYWKSGNFAGYAASDDPQTLQRFLDSYSGGQRESSWKLADFDFDDTYPKMDGAWKYLYHIPTQQFHMWPIKGVNLSNGSGFASSGPHHFQMQRQLGWPDPGDYEAPPGFFPGEDGDGINGYNDYILGQGFARNGEARHTTFKINNSYGHLPEQKAIHERVRKTLADQGYNVRPQFYGHTAAINDGRLDELVLRAQSDGGFSVNADLSDAPPDGYFTSYAGGQEIPIDQFGPGDIAQVQATLQSGDLIGAWFDRGVVYLDRSRRFEDKDECMAFATEQGQLSIYDGYTGQVVGVPGSGWEPEAPESPPAPFDFEDARQDSPPGLTLRERLTRRKNVRPVV